MSHLDDELKEIANTAEREAQAEYKAPCPGGAGRGKDCRAVAAEIEGILGQRVGTRASCWNCPWAGGRRFRRRFPA
jgi:hypothetical protein